MRGPRWLLAALVACTACDGDETALVLEVSSALDGSDLDEVSIEVRGPGLPAGHAAVARVDGPEARPFPLSLALIHQGGALGPFQASIEGRLRGMKSAQPGEPTELWFEPGRVVKRRFLLVRLAAVGGTSAGPSAPTQAMPPAMDMTPAPTPMPAPTCGSPRTCDGDKGCECKDGCCALVCRPGDDCAATCKEPGTTCTVQGMAASNLKVVCDKGARCTVDARGPNTSNATLECRAATCEMDCSTGVSNCKLPCKDGSACLLRCPGAGNNCEIEDCKPDKFKTCAGNVRVCNRDCP